MMAAAALAEQTCHYCQSQPCRCEDPDFQREVQATVYLAQLQELIRKANRSDQYAELAGVDAISLLALKDALELAIKDVDGLIGHAHEWDENDYCSICGADGRA